MAVGIPLDSNRPITLLEVIPDSMAASDLASRETTRYSCGTAPDFHRFPLCGSLLTATQAIGSDMQLYGVSLTWSTTNGQVAALAESMLTGTVPGNLRSRMRKQSPIVVICAMESEAVHLRDKLEQNQDDPFHLWRRACGEIGNAEVQVITSGIGLINAAAVTSIVCNELKPRTIINYGCSGAHRTELDCGDVVIGERIVHLSSVIVQPDGEERYAGFRLTEAGEVVMSEAMFSDPSLVDEALRLADVVDLPAWPGIEHRPRIVTGTVGSADIWNQHDAGILAHHFAHGTLCEEMEAAAIAQVCTMYGVPFLAIKDISNNELKQKSEIVGEEVLDAITLDDVREEIGLRAALLVESVIRTFYVHN